MPDAPDDAAGVRCMVIVDIRDLAVPSTITVPIGAFFPDALISRVTATTNVVLPRRTACTCSSPTMFAVKQALSRRMASCRTTC